MYYLDWQANCFLIIRLAVHNVCLLYLFDLYRKSTESAWLGEGFGLQVLAVHMYLFDIWHFLTSPPLWQYQAVEVHACKPIRRHYCTWFVECTIWCSMLHFADVFVWRIWLNELSYQETQEVNLLYWYSCKIHEDRAKSCCLPRGVSTVLSDKSDWIAFSKCCSLNFLPPWL